MCYFKILHFCLVLTGLTASGLKQEEFKPVDNPVSLRRTYKPIKLINWRWKCEADRCIRYKPDETSEHVQQHYSYLEGCKSVCGPYGSLWPYPTGDSIFIAENQPLRTFNIEDVAVKFDPKESSDALDEALTDAWTIFTQYLALMPMEEGPTSKPQIFQKKAHVLVKLTVKYKSLNLNLRTDERYTLLRHWKDHFKNDLRSDQDHCLKIDLRSDQDYVFLK
jgi:hypothetical protein